MKKKGYRTKKYTAFIIFIISIMIVSIHSYNLYMKTFSVEKWNIHIMKRENMLQDFIDKHGLIGLSKDRVEYYLGSNGKLNNYEDTYIIGRGVIDPRILKIYYDDNVVISYSVFES